MGTRSATGVRIDGVDKVSYNQHDGHYDSVGDAVVKELADDLASDPFATHEEAIESWRKKAREALLVSQDSTPTKEQIKRLKPFADTSVRTGKLTEWYVLLRNLQGTILGRLNAGAFLDSDGFINDSLSCEYGYILNLDDQPALEVYEGVQNTHLPEKGRYMAAATKDDDGYRFSWPCALIASIPVGKLAEVRDFDGGLEGWLMANGHLPTEEVEEE